MKKKSIFIVIFICILIQTGTTLFGVGFDRVFNIKYTWTLVACGLGLILNSLFLIKYYLYNENE